jgi:hypothetical protein
MESESAGITWDLTTRIKRRASASRLLGRVREASGFDAMVSSHGFPSMDLNLPSNSFRITPSFGRSASST